MWRELLLVQLRLDKLIDRGLVPLGRRSPWRRGILHRLKCPVLMRLRPIVGGCSRSAIGSRIGRAHLDPCNQRIDLRRLQRLARRHAEPVSGMFHRGDHQAIFRPTRNDSRNSRFSAAQHTRFRIEQQAAHRARQFRAVAPVAIRSQQRTDILLEVGNAFGRRTRRGHRLGEAVRRENQRHSNTPHAISLSHRPHRSNPGNAGQCRLQRSGRDGTIAGL